MKTIDFRSDTVTRPDSPMLAAMSSAEVGDDVYGDDPTVNKLQKLAAQMAGKEQALFVPSGTQSNLIALLTHCQRGDEYIVGQQAHTYRYEAGGAAVLGSIQPQPLDFDEDGTINLEKIKQAIKPDDPHFARTKLVCFENTHNGKVLPQNKIENVAAFCQDKGLKFHLDGARIANAAIASSQSIEQLCEPFDSVSICLSKGLGAPVGSILCANNEFIKSAKRWRKMLGGGMRQAGYLAAAGIYALENNLDRLENDHKNATLLYKKLKPFNSITMLDTNAQTNMIFLKFSKEKTQNIKKHLIKNNILTSIDNDGSCRLVLHKDIQEKDVLIFVKKLNEIIK